VHPLLQDPTKECPNLGINKATTRKFLLFLKQEFAVLTTKYQYEFCDKKVKQ